MKPVHLLLLVAMNCLWAGTLTIFKALSPWLDAGGIVTFRFGLAALACALLWAWLPGAAPRGRDLVRAVCIGVLVFSLGPRLQTAGVQMGRAGDAAVLMALEPLLCAVAAALVLREHIDPRRWLGLVWGMVGVLLISRVWELDFVYAKLAASGLVLASFLAETAYSVLGKPVLERAHPFKLMAVSLFAGTALNLALDGARVLERASVLPASAWLMLLYLSLVCTVFGYALWLVVIRETPVNVTALTIFMQPVAGVLIAWAWRDERPHWGQFWGCAAIIAGFIAGLRRSKGR